MLSRRHDNTPIVSDKGDDGISPEDRKNGRCTRVCVCVRASVYVHGRRHHIMWCFRKFWRSRNPRPTLCQAFCGRQKDEWELFMARESVISVAVSEQLWEAISHCGNELDRIVRGFIVPREPTL